MNITRIGYMDLSPTEIEKEIVDPDQNALRKLYVGKRITDQRSRHNRYNLKKDKRRKMKPLEVGDLVYILYGRPVGRYAHATNIRTHSGFVKGEQYNADGYTALSTGNINVIRYQRLWAVCAKSG